MRADKASAIFDTPKMPRHRQLYSARPFYLTILTISIITVLSIASRSRDRYGGGLENIQVEKRLINGSLGLAGLVKRDEECRLVHSVKDKCAFIHANCPDEEAGLFSYLSLYYCKLHHVKPVAFTIIVLWLGLLFSTIGIAASDFLCINLSTIASILGMSESLAGVTFLAFGNGSPDVFSTFAAMRTHSGSLAVGELIGAAGFIAGVVAGSMALIRPFKVARKSFVRDVGFFVVAASFSMVFLADGSLYVWECATMVGFYLFYVVFVVSWHWYLGRRRVRKDRESAARTHFHIPENQELEIEAEDVEDDPVAGERRSLRPRHSTEDFGTLENAGSPVWQPIEDEDDDETRDRYLAELRGNMRVSRPPRGERRNTMTPIRPSLVGALEFRSVLSSLEKSRNIQTIPINLRRYSDDPTFTAAQQQDNLSVVSDSHAGSAYNRSSIGDENQRPSLDAGSTRARAVSANDAAGLRLDTSVLNRDGAQPDLLGIVPSESSRHTKPGGSGLGMSPLSPVLPSPRLSISPPPSERGSRDPSPESRNARSRSPDHLAPPVFDFLSPNYQPSHDPSHTVAETPKSPRTRPGLQIPRISFPHPHSGDSSPSSPFPLYTTEPEPGKSSSRPPSIRLPPPGMAPVSPYTQQLYVDDDDDEFESRPLKWWPYKILPPPQVLMSTLFPTLYSWRKKNVWDKFLGVMAAPSVFLLTITLPVVEPEKDDDDKPDPDPGTLSPRDGSRSRTDTLATLPPDSPSLTGNPGGHRVESQQPTSSTQNGSAALLKGSPMHARQDSEAPAHPHRADSSPSISKEWNRWLVSLQLFTAPFFVVLIVWANSDDDLNPRNLLLGILGSLIFSLAALALLLFLTTPSKPPRYRPLLCFLGFIVSISWISTIANEVVGVLKAFGVILGISDAILGLTIFAVGNSLGDLVADITVARIGYPVMALSACFGGPMLNILLGIGVSGLYMTLKGGAKRHAKHPKRPIKYKPYQVEVSGTLLISGVTLLVTLVGLLIVVPLNKWRMDRKIGWGLIILWSLSTIGNVVVEIMGWDGDLT